MVVSGFVGEKNGEDRDPSSRGCEGQVIYVRSVGTYVRI